MKVTDDPFYKALMVGPVLRSQIAEHMADLIHASLGTKYEKQKYTVDEHRWAAIVRGKSFNHTTGREN